MTELEYQVLRYRPFAFPGEWVAVGVLVAEVATGRFIFQRATSIQRARGLFATLDLSDLRAELRRLEAAFSSLARGYAAYEDTVLPLPLVEGRSVTNISARVHPPNDAALQFGEVYRGRDESLEAFTADLLVRVLEAHRQPQRERLSDQEVWKRKFTPTVGAEALRAFQPTYRVTATVKPLRFEYGYQNGRLHLIDPASFDLEDEGIARKLERRFGRYSMLAQSGVESGFRVYVPLLLPQAKKRRQEIGAALASDNFGPGVEVALYRPDEAGRLRDDLASIGRDNEAAA